MKEIYASKYLLGFSFDMDGDLLFMKELHKECERYHWPECNKYHDKLDALDMEDGQK